MTDVAPPTPRAFTVAVLADHWGVSDTFIYDQIGSGRLRAFKLGNKLLRIAPDAVAEYEAAAQLATDPAPASGAIPAPDPATIARLARSARRPKQG